MKHPSSSSLLVSAALVLGLFACSSSKTENTPGSSGGADAGGADTGTEPPSGGTQCTAAREQTLVPIGKVSSAEVTVVSTDGDVTTLYVDASAGGFNEASKNPRVYVKLDGFTRVAVTDKAAFESADWDLALKRTLVYTNSGDTGVGKGGGMQVKKSFDAVTAADADDAEIKPEKLFDDECVAAKDEIGAPVTTFTGWYQYNEATNEITGPTPNLTFIVRSADGSKKYKVGIVSFRGKPDGTTTNPASGHFLFKVAPL